MRFLRGSVLLLALIFGSVLGIQQTVAQEASPSADCVLLTEAEIDTLATDYLVAAESGDSEAIDDILHDDVTHNLDDVANNQPGNDDEILIFETLDGIEFTIMEVLGSEETQSATILYSFSLMDGEVGGTALALVELECGQVKTIHQESTALGAILSMGGMDVEATPAP